MRRSSLVISVDTAILHLAAALDCRVIGLHGPTLSRRWGAKSSGAVSIDSPHPAAGYISFGFERHSEEYEIMRAIPVDTVYRTAQSILATQRTEAPACQPIGSDLPEPTLVYSSRLSVSAFRYRHRWAIAAGPPLEEPGRGRRLRSRNLPASAFRDIAETRTAPRRGGMTLLAWLLPDIIDPTLCGSRGPI